MTTNDFSMAAGGFGRPAQAGDGPTSASMQINPALKTHMRNDIMRNGINEKNAAMARMIDGDGGVFDTMANMGMGEMREAQVAYAETSMQGNMFLMHSANDLARDPGQGNGMMIDAYATPDMEAGPRAEGPQIREGGAETPLPSGPKGAVDTATGMAVAGIAGGGAAGVSAMGKMAAGPSSPERKVTTIKGKRISASALEMAEKAERATKPSEAPRPAIHSEDTTRAASAKLPVEEGEAPDPTGHKAPSMQNGVEVGAFAAAMGMAAGAGAAGQAPGNPVPQPQPGPFAPKDPREKKEPAPPSSAPKEASAGPSVKLDDVLRQSDGRRGLGIASLAVSAAYMSPDDEDDKKRKKRKLLVGDLNLHDNRPEYRDKGAAKEAHSLDALLERVATMSDEYYDLQVRKVLEKRMDLAKDPKKRAMYRALLQKCEDARKEASADG